MIFTLKTSFLLSYLLFKSSCILFKFEDNLKN